MIDAAHNINNERDWKIIEVIDELGLLSTWQEMAKVHEYARNNATTARFMKVWGARINKERNFTLGHILFTLFLTIDTSRKYTGFIGRSLHDLDMDSEWEKFEKILNRQVVVGSGKKITVKSFLSLLRSSAMTHNELQRDKRLPAFYEMNGKIASIIDSSIEEITKLSWHLERRLVLYLKKKYPKLDADRFLTTLW